MDVDKVRVKCLKTSFYQSLQSNLKCLQLCTLYIIIIVVSGGTGI